MRRWRMRPLVLLAVIALATPPATAAPSLHLATAREEVRAFIFTDGPPEQPAAVMTRNTLGRWTPPSLLPRAVRGLPLVHRDITWFLEARTDPEGRPYHALLPVSGEPGGTGMRIECIESLVASAVSVEDGWTFLIWDQAAGGEVMMRAITSHGSTFEMEVVEERRWMTGWAPEARLLAGGNDGPTARAVAVTPSGTILVSAATESTIATPPSLDASSGSPHAACAFGSSLVVAAATADGVTAWILRNDSWGEPMTLRTPRLETLAAVASAPGAIIAGVASGPAPQFVAATLDEAWGAIETASLATPPAPDDAVRPTPPTPVERAEFAHRRLRTIRMVIAIAGVVLVGGLLLRLAATRVDRG